MLQMDNTRLRLVDWVLQPFPAVHTLVEKVALRASGSEESGRCYLSDHVDLLPAP